MSATGAEHIRAFRCPKCGNDGSLGTLRLLEDIICYRPVIGVKNGVLEIDGLYQTDGYDGGSNMRFECRARIASDDDRYAVCEHEWPVPRWLYDRIDWV